MTYFRANLCILPYILLQESVSTSSGSSEWHLNFQIPEQDSFSESVKQAIDSGEISSKGRREFVQALCTHISVFTAYPTSEQYNAVSRALVTKYLNLKDPPFGTQDFVGAAKAKVPR